MKIYADLRWKLKKQQQHKACFSSGSERKKEGTKSNINHQSGSENIL